MSARKQSGAAVAESTERLARAKRKREQSPPGTSTQRKKLIPARPQLRLDVYVFGNGENGELGLGVGLQDGKKTKDVSRPRLNPHLSTNDVGITKIAAGGMHALALTYDSRILSWGVNDEGALGRDTTWEGAWKDAEAEGLPAEQDADSDNDDDEEADDRNPLECTPGEVDFSNVALPETSTFDDIAAGDSISLALTNTGHVYGWGTFRKNDGPFSFSPGVIRVTRPHLVHGLQGITSIKAGANHALALDNRGNVFAWGTYQQGQLGRQLVEARKPEVTEQRIQDFLVPRRVDLPRGPVNGIASIAIGADHSFAITKTGNVYSWGLNNFGQTGHMHNAGTDGAMIVRPAIIEGLRGKSVVSIKGGSHHSIAATADGKCYTFGRADHAQLGFTQEQLSAAPEHAIVRDERGRPRIAAPLHVTAIQGQVVQVTASSDHNIAITKEWKAWSWGFSASFQTGQGTEDDVVVPQLIDNTAIREKTIDHASAGGQFGILTGLVEL